MNNLMMNLYPGNEFAIGDGYHPRRGIYLGNLRPVGVRLRPDGEIGYRDYHEVEFDPKVFAFAVECSNAGSWERRVFTLNSLDSALRDTWANYNAQKQKDLQHRNLMKSLTKEVESLAKQLFGEENAAISYGDEIRLDNIKPEQLLLVCKIRGLTTLNKYKNLFVFSFSSEDEGRKLIETMKSYLT